MGGTNERYRKATMPEVQLYKNNKDKEELETSEVNIVSDPKSVIYWQVHTETLQALHGVSLHFGINDRIPVFRVFTEIEKMRKHPDKWGFPEHVLIDAESHLERLMKYRKAGYEPAHKDDRYV